MVFERKPRIAWRLAAVWMAALFAAMPAVSSAFAAPVGAFSRVFLHIHAVSSSGHAQLAAHDHVHDHEDGGVGHNHHDEPASDEAQDGSSDLLHVHHEVAYPSMLVPAAIFPRVTHRLAARLRVPTSLEPPSELRGRLLRPPI